MKHLVVNALTVALVAMLNLSLYAVGGIRIGGCSDTCGVAGCGALGNCGVQNFASQRYLAQHSFHQTGPTDSGHDPVSAINSNNALAAQNTELRQLVECMPITAYKVVLEPQYVTESRAVVGTEYQDEVRYRTRTVSRTEPVQVQDYRSKTVMVPKTESKTIEYSVLVPETSQKTVELVETVPVWKDVSETYTVKVPHVEEQPEEYEVEVPKLRDEQFTYTVYVPKAETQTKSQTVTNAVPVTKTRTVQVCIPTTNTQTVTRDYGHWETRVDEVVVSGMTFATEQPSSVSYGSGCGFNMGGCGSYVTGGIGCSASVGCGPQRGCGSCGDCSDCGGCGSMGAHTGCGSFHAAGVVPDCGYSVAATPTTQTVSRRVWVPNVVTEEVPVVENQTHTQEVAYTVYEQRSEQIPYEVT